MEQHDGQPITVAIIEDDPGYQIGLKAIIDGETGLTLILAASSVEQFEAEGVRPDVVLLDLGLRGNGVEGPDAVRRLVAAGHRLLVVSMTNQEVPVVAAIAAGAHGYLTKEAEPEHIIRAIRTVIADGTYISPTVAGYLLRDQTRLTDRETEVLAMVAEGERAADIAKYLFISVSTVNGHLENIRNKSGYRNKADLTRLAFEKGILSHRRKRRST
jgi:DNA-binding NarL/FixJ family response regulator